MTDVPPHGAISPLQGLAFLELGERLRQRGQLSAAATVAQAGLGHYPGVADAHDLLGRIRADEGDDAGAIVAWNAALECDPNHIGAWKGLAFVAFRARDFGAAERHLELAAARAPRDATVLAALDRVRVTQRRAPIAETPQLNDPGSGLLLYDDNGLRLAGSADDSGDDELADAVAAEAAGVSRESARMARLLDLGAVQHLLIESSGARIAIVPVSAGASLLVQRAAATPLGRLLALANRAAHASREWLGRVR